MEKCSICGEPGNQSICPKCTDERRQRHSPEAFWEKVKVTKAEWQQLSEKSDVLNMEVIAGDHGIPYPDSTHRIENLSRDLRAAFQKYQQAMEEYTRALMRWDD